VPGLFVKDFIRKEYTVAVGKVAPDFNSKYSDGLFTKLSSVCSKNKYVLIDFWASWCSPCRESFTNLKDYHKKLNPNGFEIIAISLDNDKQSWANAILKDEVGNFKHTLINLGSKDKLVEDISKKYAFNGIPFYLLLDEKCRVIAKTHDIKIILNKLDTVYKK
jgi:thiol-disulfide isomerase/thioredoxin